MNADLAARILAYIDEQESSICDCSSWLECSQDDHGTASALRDEIMAGAAGIVANFSGWPGEPSIGRWVVDGNDLEFVPYSQNVGGKSLQLDERAS
jgi:hypothetical protein